jgi:hypothetical protein
MDLFSSPVIQTSSVTADRRLSQTSDCGQTRNSTTCRVNVLITERLAEEEQTGLAFKEALNRMRTMREGLQAQLELIPAADGTSARGQSRSPSDVPTPPASSKDVTTEGLTRDQAARSPAKNRAARTGMADTALLTGFPLPKASRARNNTSRPRKAAIPNIEPIRPIRPLNPDHTGHRSNKPARPAEPRTVTTIPNSSGADSGEAVARVSSGHHQSSWEARQISTTTQKRKDIVCLFTLSLASKQMA